MKNPIRELYLSWRILRIQRRIARTKRLIWETMADIERGASKHPERWLN